ncbi:MAG: nickel-responsive transcriptional regulator NikR [Candidatus Tectomicrobia bacterium]|uniref:Putative nickel-responsive regulator n=1 Tax=Tectimicrobiota bacterium TaxID=2528274 RepID=A0A933GMM3_UNCTE|nr:nickel-responsive transcriptional regulator NikR [Candidatus Tectomicrobia bacterium]
MGELLRFGISIEEKLLQEFDKHIAHCGYQNRSEAIRDLIRNYLVENRWEVGIDEMVGTITIVYDHEIRELTEKLVNWQHDHSSFIISTLHVHLDEHHCLEVLVVKGQAGEIKILADNLLGTKGVKHGKLTMTTTGQGV